MDGEPQNATPVRAVTDNATPSYRADNELSMDTLLTPHAARLALEPPSKETLLGEHTANVEQACKPTTVETEEKKQTVESLNTMRKRRGIFTDAEEDDDEHGFSSSQVFSVDATATAVETTMQPERDGRRGAAMRMPLRARRVLNLMDRLEPNATGSAQATTEGDASDDPPGLDVLVVRRSWKRRLAETTTAASSGLPRLVPAPVERRPAFGRSRSSQSVLLPPPKMAVPRSTSALEVREEISGSACSFSRKVHSLVLPTVRSKSHPDLNVIAPQTVADLMNGKYSDRLDSFSLIDCRFGYEYAGGCLKGALSMNDPAQVEEQFLRKPPKNADRIALIFYCEFSANRAPKMLRHIRNLDRWIHAERYPELFYPELYLVDGGYKNCFETLKDVICHPPQYQTMSDKTFVDQCKKAFGEHRANWKQHKSNACTSKFQQLHRPIHDVFRDDSRCDDLAHHRDAELLAHPVDLRSFSQQI